MLQLFSVNSVLKGIMHFGKLVISCPIPGLIPFMGPSNVFLGAMCLDQWRHSQWEEGDVTPSI